MSCFESCANRTACLPQLGVQRRTASLSIDAAAIIPGHRGIEASNCRSSEPRSPQGPGRGRQSGTRACEAQIARGQAEGGERVRGPASRDRQGLGRVGRLQRDNPLPPDRPSCPRHPPWSPHRSTERRSAKAILGGARVLIDPRGSSRLDGPVRCRRVPGRQRGRREGQRASLAPLPSCSVTTRAANPRHGSPERPTWQAIVTSPRSGMNPLVHFAIKGQREGRPVRSAQGGAKARSFTPCQLPLAGRSSPRIGGHSLLQLRKEPSRRSRIPCWARPGRTLRSSSSKVAPRMPIPWRPSGSLKQHVPPRTTFHYRDQRHLVGDNRNYGISRAQGRYVVCLDPDDELEPVYLEVALFLAEAFALRPCVPICPMLRRVRRHLARIGRVVPRHAEGRTTSRRSLSSDEAPGWRRAGSATGALATLMCQKTGPSGFSGGGWVVFKAIRQPLMRYHVHAGSLSASASSDLAAYRPAIRDASADLLEGASVLATEPDSGMAQNLYCNLLSRGPSEGVKGSVLIAMPYVTVGGAERLMASLAATLVEDGYRVIVVTSSELPENTPDGTSVLRASTGQVYELPRLFTDQAQRGAYLLFLIQRYRVDTLLVVGSRLCMNCSRRFGQPSVHRGRRSVVQCGRPYDQSQRVRVADRPCGRAIDQTQDTAGGRVGNLSRGVSHPACRPHRWHWAPGPKDRGEPAGGGLPPSGTSVDGPRKRALICSWRSAERWQRSLTRRSS